MEKISCSVIVLILVVFPVTQGKYSGSVVSGSDINILDKCVTESLTPSLGFGSGGSEGRNGIVNSGIENSANVNNNGNSNGNPGQDVSLSCHLGTINSEFERVNLSSLPGDVLVSLRMDCSPHIFYQSALEKSSLSHLNRLAALHIEHCKLSRLPEHVFAGLTSLRNLTVRTHNTAWPALSLDIGQGVFNGLPRLDRIDLSANNIWTFPQHSFCQLANSLRVLNVSRNRLQDLSALSFNEISFPPTGGNMNSLKRASQISSALSASACQSSNMGLEVLDVSSNRLILLPPNGLSKLTFLRSLHLQENEITVVASEALSKLRRLQIINLSGNKVESLPGQLFQDNLELEEIYLQNNSLVDLSPGLLANLGQLVILDLSRNKLTFNMDKNSPSPSNNGSHFSSLIRLVNLDLSYNRLSHLTSDFFGGQMFSLQILDLSYNEIEMIEGNSFAALKNLHTLTLSHNKLTFIDSTTFNGLFVLTFLSLDNNQLDNIHLHAFHNNSNVRDINLNGNSFPGVPAAVQNLTFLKTLDLGENSIVELDESKVKLIGLPNLYGLRLTGNQISNVSQGFFKELTSLKIVNLARNKISHLTPGTFDLNYNLQAARVDANYLKDISGVFSNLPNLLWLNVSDNQLNWFDYAVIPPQLKWLDLHKNEIVQLDNANNLGVDLGGEGDRSKSLRLQTLDASFNKLTRLSSSSIPHSVENLNLNDNLIASIDPSTFYLKGNLTRVDLSMNQLETLEESAIQLKPTSNYNLKMLPEFYLGQNPFTCDCHLEWLQRINSRAQTTRQYPVVADLDRLFCAMPYHQSVSSGENSKTVKQHSSSISSGSSNSPDFVQFKSSSPVLPISSVSPDQFLCPYTSHCPDSCMCCDYDSCDCKMQCPAGCLCFHDNSWQVNIVDCSASGSAGNSAGEVESEKVQNFSSDDINNENSELPFVDLAFGVSDLQRKTVPAAIPMDSTVIYLDGNDLGFLPSHVFIGRKNLQTLFLNNSRLDNIMNNSFTGLRNLQTLHLQHNNLRELLGHEFHMLENLRELFLHNNQLSFVQANSFSNLKNLQTLTLNGNKLSHFPIWTMDQNLRLDNLAIHNNPWTCECDFVSVAIPWIRANFHKLSVFDLENGDPSENSGGSIMVNLNCIHSHSGQSLPLLQMNSSGCSSSSSNSNSHFNFDYNPNIFKGVGDDRNLQGIDMDKGQVKGEVRDPSNNTNNSENDSDMFPYLPSLLAIGAVILFVSTVFVAVCRKRNCLRDWVTGSISGSRSNPHSSSGSTPSFWSQIACPCPTSGSGSGSTSCFGESGSGCYDKTMDGEQDKLFDAYIAYSSNDEVWVSQILATNLQQSASANYNYNYGDSPYRLCLHYRDFVMTHYVADTIVEAVESSKRTVIVLSKNFLQSEWCSFEFKSALHTAIRGGVNMKNRLVIVTLGDMSTRDLDPDLRIMLRHAIVLQANDKLFWEKLKNALPEPRPPVHPIGGHTHTHSHSHGHGHGHFVQGHPQLNSNINLTLNHQQTWRSQGKSCGSASPQMSMPTYYDINERQVQSHHGQNVQKPLPPPPPPFPMINPINQQPHHLHPLPNPQFSHSANIIPNLSLGHGHGHPGHGHGHGHPGLNMSVSSGPTCPHGLLSVSNVSSHSQADTQYSYVEST